VATFTDTRWPILRTALFFLSGGTLYLYRDRIRFTRTYLLIASASLFVLMFYWRAAAIGVASAGAYLLLYLGNRQSMLLSHFSRVPDISYGTYLYGWPIQKLLLWHIPTLSPWALFALCTPLALLAGTISWYLVEKPALRFKKRAATYPASVSDAVKT
jgi:peptidoglycan/LPS O-acetylase OafA/YrhL